MKLRFQADAYLNDDIVTGVLRREPSIDFQTATSADLRGLSDMEVLALAAAQGRILVSHDRKTMPKAFGTLILRQPSPGLFVVSQKTDLLVVIDAWAASDHDEWTNRIVALPF